MRPALQIHYSDYELHPLGSWNARVGGRGLPPDLRPKRGALLRVHGDGAFGYADLCPLPEYGDPSVDRLLESVQAGQPLPLVEQSLKLAENDLLARKEGRSLFSTAKIKNHFLCTDILDFDLNSVSALIEAGFSEIKVKMGRQLRLETEMLNALFSELQKDSGTRLQVRLDFNSVPNAEQFEAWLQGISKEHLKFIEFIEDPFTYDRSLWRNIRQKYGISLAADLVVEKSEIDEDAFDVLILKPARQDAGALVQRFPEKRMVVTHSMDFAVGQLHALAVAHQLAVNSDALLLSCGLQMLGVFEASPFQSLINYEGPFILPPEGTGIGLEATLAAQDWERLV